MVGGCTKYFVMNIMVHFYLLVNLLMRVLTSVITLLDIMTNRIRKK